MKPGPATSARAITPSPARRAGRPGARRPGEAAAAAASRAAARRCRRSRRAPALRGTSRLKSGGAASLPRLGEQLAAPRSRSVPGGGTSWPKRIARFADLVKEIGHLNGRRGAGAGASRPARTKPSSSRMARSTAKPPRSSAVASRLERGDLGAQARIARLRLAQLAAQAQPGSDPRVACRTQRRRAPPRPAPRRAAEPSRVPPTPSARRAYPRPAPRAKPPAQPRVARPSSRRRMRST